MATQDKGISCMERTPTDNEGTCQAYLLVIVCRALEHARFVLPPRFLPLKCLFPAEDDRHALCSFRPLLEGAGSRTDSYTHFSSSFSFLFLRVK